MSTLDGSLVISKLFRAANYIWDNKSWIFDGVGIAVIGVAITIGRTLFPFREHTKPRSADPQPRAEGQGGRFEFSDGVVAYAKLGLNWQIVDAFTMYSTVKSTDDFVSKIGPLVQARAAYRLEKFEYHEAKERRRQIELELVEELKSEFAAYGMKLNGITIGSFVRKNVSSEKRQTKAIPLGTQTKRLSISIAPPTKNGISLAEILLIFRVTNLYNFVYGSVDGPYAFVQPQIEAEVRFELATTTLESVPTARQFIEQRLLEKLFSVFANVGLKLDEIKILNIH